MRCVRRFGAATVTAKRRAAGPYLPTTDWDRLQAAAKPARSDPKAWLAMGDIFGDLASKNPAYVSAFSAALTSLWTKGVRTTLADYLQGGA